MAKIYISMLLVHILLPTGLLLSMALRPFGLSIFYLLLYLLAPLTSSVNPKNVKGWRGNFFLINMVVPISLLVVHAAWHSVLAAFAPYGSLLETLPLLKQIGYNLGLVSYASIDPLMTMHYLAPELVMTFTSIIVCIGVKKLLSDPKTLKEKKDSKYQKFPLLTRFGKYISLFLIMLSGILKPSVTSGIYFLVFIGSATAWALGHSLDKGFAVVLKCLMAIMAGHISVLFAYQCSWLSELYPPEMDFARYFGLVKFVNLNNTTSEDLSFTYELADGHVWETYGSPIVILLTYYVLALESRELFKPKEKKKSALTGVEAGKLNGSLMRGVSFHRGGAKDKWKQATSKVKAAFSYIDSKILRENRDESAPLIQKASAHTRWPSYKSKSRVETLRQDSTGSVIVADDETSINTSRSNLLDDIVAAIIDLSQVLVRSSYIATTITMTAWSIMFHSWLTFVFLMWANVVWLRQDQRSFMLKTSPILVCYAVLLLLLQYIYAMDLNENELPSNVTAVNMRQIGVSRVEGEPVVPLVVKSLFTWMFWVTLRQRVSQLRRRRTSAALTDMAAPLQLTVSAAASGLEAQREEETQSRLLRRFGEWLRAACARYWIYVVVIMLFVIGITGERMTIFRIIYMMLFLIFILMFQISWYWWRRLMYLFWITVIIYAMINLILIYVYQFDNFSKSIETYLLINERLQHDLGLDTYHPADLFVKLLTPTCFLIITIMQVHYFHKDFMALSDPKTFSFKTSVKDAESERQSQAGASTMKDDLPPLPLEGEEAPVSMEGDEDLTSMRSGELSTLNTKRSVQRKLTRTRSYAPTITEQKSITFKQWAAKTFESIKTELNEWKNLMFIYLDLHLVKVIFVALMLLCVINTCAMHVPIIVIIAPVILLKSKQQRYCLLIISTLISIYFLLKMVYQIDYIQHDFFDVNCTVVYENFTTNVTKYSNAEWVGFEKVTKEKPLATILKSYISLIVLFTFYSLVTYRQQTIRKLDSSLRSDVSRRDDKVMFPDVTRKDADIDLLHCAKYLMNYGFYKFGVEITLMCLMGVIGSRMDLYAVFYAGWLLVLVSMSRKKKARVWATFTGFVTVLLPLQYFMAVGFMPQFCIDYPWKGDDEQMKHVRSWLFLPYNASPPHATKLIFDFFLLLFASRQLRVFRLEKNAGPDSPAGDNDEKIGQDWETPTFVNPVPDFLSYVGTWLDVIKRMVFLGMLWVTLAIMFLTGTNRVNLFSMGYLIGSFIFLWQGTDFYLRPKKAILRWWSWLLLYNVSVVVVKTLLQIPGCMFSGVMQKNACWLVQLLGIGCVDKFAGGNIARFLKMHFIKQDVCSVPQEDIGLAWDGVCFAFLILQRRLFLSYYFYRVIDESKATTVLASRGAELIEELREKQMLVQEAQEVKILEKIKIKMERIKANQKKVQGLTKEPKNHDADEEDEDEDDTQVGESERAAASPRGFHTPDSAASPRGLNTPDAASPRGFRTPLSEASAPGTPAAASPVRAVAPPLSTITTRGPPSPSSALMTVSLDAYLEPRRISFSSPASSQLRALSPEESYPVFSPPPIRRRHTLASPSLPPRSDLFSGASVSRIEPNSHHTWTETDGTIYPQIHAKCCSECYRRMPRYSPPASHQKAIRSGDYYMFDEFDDTDVQVQEEESSSDEEGPKEMGIGKLLSTVLKTDLKHAVSMRRASMPAFRQARPQSLGTIPHSYPKEMVRKSSRSDVTHEADVNIDMSERRERDDDVSDLEEEQIADDTWFGKLKMYLDTVVAFINSILVSLTRHLMKYSRDYRYVSRTLSIEKKILKEKDGFGIGLREGSQMIWAPLPETLISHKELTTLEEQDDSMFKQDNTPLVHLAYALWYAVLAHTDIVCYIMVFINQIQSATILSIPLPLMVFMWGTLTIPRPTKTFWVTLIAYTEVIVLIKSMFQFEILPWNQVAIPANMPFTAPRIIGIERKGNYALYDLILLLIIFLHRFMLKSLGLWKESTPEAEIQKDMEYPMSNEDKLMVVEGRASEIGKKYVQLHTATSPDKEKLSDGSPKHDQIQTVDQQEAGPSKPSDDHFSVNDDMEPIIAVTTTLEDPYKNYSKFLMLSVKRYLQPVQFFFKRMLEPGARVTADVYAYMFLCDFFNFLVVIFGFAAFGTHQGDGGVQAYLEENKVPIPFLVMLILQFGLIVIDRALYLRKFILGKILFQYALVIGVHIWMFFVLPFITERTFNALLPPPMWYMLKCLYLLLSAYQIRCGYPRRIIGNFLCKSYRFLNMTLFRGFMAVPFVFELRTLMDWIWTDTSMTLMDWLKMEDIFASVFLLKCSRYVEDEYPQPRGVKKSSTSKYLLGGGVLAFVIAIIWFPLVFFAFGNTVGEPNPPTDVTVKIRIGPFLPVYQMSAQSHNIDMYAEQDYTQLSNIYARDRTAQTFLSNYMYNDIAVVTINPNSTMTWEISPPELDRLEKEAVSNATLKIKFSYVITHLTNSAQNPPTIDEQREVSLEAYEDSKRNVERDKLLALLAGTASPDTWINVKKLFPKFLKVFNKGTVKPAYQLMPPTNVEDAKYYRDVQLRLERHAGAMYWRVREACDPQDPLLSIPMNNCDMLIMYTFNDKLFPETLNFISGSGIIGLYTTFVFLASRVLRGFFSGIYTKIMFDDLPNVDRVLQLCLDIYLVREAVELALEEDLFAKLVFLYRSPETMIKWSRPKEEPPQALPPPEE